jgi:amino acid transporter
MSGTGALVIAVLTVAMTLTIVLAAIPSISQVHVERPSGGPVDWWRQFTFIVLAISGVEAVANMTGIMVEPVDRTARRSIAPVLFEIVVLNLVMTLAVQALPLEVLGGGDPTKAYSAHRDDMLRLLAEHYVGPIFAAVASFMFAFLLLSAVNTAIVGLVGIQYMMARDKELPPAFGGLNPFGMPVVPLVVAAIVPLVVVIAIPDVGHLADLYAIGVVGAVAINLGTTATNFELDMKRGERSGIGTLALIMSAIWLTIAWEKPWALAFATSIMGAGLTLRWTAHNRAKVREWLLADVPTMLQSPEETFAETHEIPATSVLAVPIVEPAYTPVARVMAATRWNPRLVRFAVEEAKIRRAELLVLFVRQFAVVPMGPIAHPNVHEDADALKLFADVKAAAEPAGVPFRPVYAVAYDAADTILDLAATYGVDILILGTTQRGALWRTMKGDVIQEVAEYLPEQTRLLIHA